MDPVLLLRAAYLSAAALVMVVFALPALRSRFLEYGPRSSISHKQRETDQKSVKAGAFTALLDQIAALQVPHSWFTSFYAMSSILSFLWLYQVARGGSLYAAIAKRVADAPRSMTTEQVVVTWALMFFQGNRRLYECLTLSKPSNSTMWFGHWALGILFYTLTSVAVWIEGVPFHQTPTWPSIKDHVVSKAEIISAFSVLNLSARTYIGLIIFILGTGLQHDCHAYLAALRAGKVPGMDGSKYHFPQHPAFNLSLTPHYFAECVIYLGLAITAAPEGSLLNWTLVSALVFVGVNLSVTAHGTKQWYSQKFGADAVEGRAKMIPFVF